VYGIDDEGRCGLNQVDEFGGGRRGGLNGVDKFGGGGVRDW